jgi:superfamily II DNA or RNA helicase
MDLRKTISSSNSWLDLKAKIDASPNTKDKGDLFELLTKLYLQIDPRYVSKLKTVWLLNEIPTNTLKKLNLPTKDMGIDLVAETNEGEYWAIQCKYKADESKSLTWREISTFQSLAFSKAKGISFGLVATTVDRSANVFKDQKEDVKLLAGEIWRDLDVEFFKQAKKLLALKVVRPVPFQPRKHQQRAVSNARQHFVLGKATRGKMIMPCGTGKSLTAYWIAKELEAKTVVIAVPSLSLINQTLKAWLREVIANKQVVDWIAICSDKTAGEVDSAISTQDLGVPTNTDPEVIAKWLRKRSQGLKVVFTTYQSGKVLAEASRIAKRVFDLGIMDEAHKTVGDRDKTFAHLLSDENIKIRKRVFMTATERRYAGNRDEIISMDNPEVYGDTFELLTFKEALEQDPPILSDYKILTMLIHKEDVAKYIQERSIVKPDRGRWDDGVQAEMLAGVIALQKAMQKYPIKHAVSFHTSIAKAQAFKGNQKTFTEAVEKDTDQVETFFVSGKTPTSIRSRVIKEFAGSKKALISNARCLTEGVDVPNIDGILFADPKRSAVDIVQAVGRALRLSDGKDYGYIIIPVLIEDETDFEKSGAFQTILTVLRALASNDERIVEYFREKSTYGNNRRKLIEHGGTEHLLEHVNLDQFVESIDILSWNRLAKLSWRPFVEARRFVQALGLNSSTDWRKYTKGELSWLPTKPADIPANPRSVYRKNGWVSNGDWIGTGEVATFLRDYRSFSKARKFVQKLNLSSSAEWRSYVRGERHDLPILPKDIPANPLTVYKINGWKSMGDWLGTGFIATADRQYRSFEQAREFVHSLGLKSNREWRKYIKNHKLPQDISSHPDRTYSSSGWKNWGDWLGTGRLSEKLKTFRDYNSANNYVLKLGLKNQKEWSEYCKSGELPEDIPIAPQVVYSQDWKGIGEWLGTGTIAPRNRKYLPYKEAQIFVGRLNLKSGTEWKLYLKGELKNLPALPENIPRTPHWVYKNSGWSNTYEWLGIGSNYLPYSEAIKFVHSLELRSQSEWNRYTLGKMADLPKLPSHLPSSPSIIYKNRGWVNIQSWLGSKFGIRRKKPWKSYQVARIFVKSLGLKDHTQWLEYNRGLLKGLPSKPEDIPAQPYGVYRNKGWKSWGDWLGNTNVHPSEISWKSYRQALAFIRKLKLKNQNEWNLYKKGLLPHLPRLPNDIPHVPERVYEDKGWTSLGEWLGTGKIATRKKNYISYSQAKIFVHSLKLKNSSEWKAFIANEMANLPSIPANIPNSPYAVYSKLGDWKGWPDFLGYEPKKKKK